MVIKWREGEVLLLVYTCDDVDPSGAGNSSRTSRVQWMIGTVALPPFALHRLTHTAVVQLRVLLICYIIKGNPSKWRSNPCLKLNYILFNFKFKINQLHIKIIIQLIRYNIFWKMRFRIKRWTEVMWSRGCKNTYRLLPLLITYSYVVMFNF